MKKLILTAALFVAATQASAKGMTAEEHSEYIYLQQAEMDQKLGGGFVTVGDQGNCDYQQGTSRIQDAIDFGATEIRISSSTYTENLTIDDESIELIGGFSTCTDAENNNSNNARQIINGSGNSAAVISITGNSQRNSVTLKNLELKAGDGTSSGFLTGGGVATLNADLYLTLDNVWLVQNVGLLGGGISVISGNTDIVLNDTLLANNNAQQGGGIYCSSGDASILVNQGDAWTGGFFNNSATNGDGGGALITSGCTFTSYSGGKGAGFRGFRSNKASRHGGAIALLTNGTANLYGNQFCIFFLPPLSPVCYGDRANPVNLNVNTADTSGDNLGFGGGIYASGADATLSIVNALITNNAAQSGGGISIEDEASLTMGAALRSCWSPGSCSQVTYNKTHKETFPVRGGGIYATTGATANISNTLFSDNRADYGTAIYAATDNDVDAIQTTLDIEGALIVNNGDDGADEWSDIDTIRNNLSKIKIDFSTIADNDILDTSANINNTGDIEIFSSIIHNDDGTLVYRGTDYGTNTIPFECLILNEIDSLPVEPELILDDPNFVDRANGDYHINSVTSPAVDFCGTFNSSVPDYNDSDNDERGFDDNFTNNFRGPYDIGYDETYDNDLIFKNGFEDSE